jgi:sugar phosphate isomerase/epimerase
MIRRRTFLFGMGAASIFFGEARFSIGCQTNAWPVDPQNFDSLLAVLQKIREFGGAGFETGFRNLQSQAGQTGEARKKIESTGLRFFGVHIFLPEYDPHTDIAPAELYREVAETGAALGAERLILSGAPASSGPALTGKAAAINLAGEFAKGQGLQLAYHNHDKEFRNSEWEIRGLLRRTDPALVNFLLDAGHAFRGAADVPVFLEENHHRIIGLHLRDFRQGHQVPLGAGDFPLPQVAATLRRVGWHGWVLAEEEREDGSKPGEASIRPALEALKRYFA